MKRLTSLGALALVVLVSATPVLAATTTAPSMKAAAASPAAAPTKVMAPRTTAPAATSPGAKPAAAPKVAGSVGEAAKLDLNSATRDELMKTPGIGEAIATKIVAGRPFKTKSELLTRGLVNRAQYAQLAPHVIAKQK